VVDFYQGVIVSGSISAAAGSSLLR
jgi:hypothetical protein